MEIAYTKYLKSVQHTELCVYVKRFAVYKYFIIITDEYSPGLPTDRHQRASQFPLLSPGAALENRCIGI